MTQPDTPSHVAATAQAERAKNKRRARLMLVAKLAVLAGVIVFMLRQPWDELKAALLAISFGAFVYTMATQCVSLVLGAVRWRFLMQSYGADQLPPLRAMIRAYFVGYFYNTYVPGAIGGDVLRGVITRGSFRDGGATSAVAIVFVERAQGLFAVVMLAAMMSPLDGQGQLGRLLLPFCALGALAVLAMVIGIAQGRRIAPYMPARIATILQGLPVLSRKGPFVVGLLLSLVVQVLTAISGHALVASVYPSVLLSQSLLVMPIVGGAGFIPLSMLGAGPRDLVLVNLYNAVGVPKAAGTATSFGLLVASLAVSALGGLWQLRSPISQERMSNPG